MSSKEKLASILNALKDRIASPSDIISTTGLPRYEVLAAFHILEALGLIEVVYIRGNYKLYKLSKDGEKVLNALLNRAKFNIMIEEKGGSFAVSGNVSNIEATSPSSTS